MLPAGSAMSIKGTAEIGVLVCGRIEVRGQRLEEKGKKVRKRKVAIFKEKLRQRLCFALSSFT